MNSEVNFFSYIRKKEQPNLARLVLVFKVIINITCIFKICLYNPLRTNFHEISLKNSNWLDFPIKFSSHKISRSPDFPDEAGNFKSVLEVEEEDRFKAEGELKNSYQPPRQLTIMPIPSFRTFNLLG